MLIRDPVTGAAVTEVIGTTTYPLVQAYTKDAGQSVSCLPGVSIPRDAEGNLVLTDACQDGTRVYLRAQSNSAA